ncbi:hypothetical protein [Phreatobacter oligotrophus]|nr:hypothetical protein [Phreatobacter oligotrophus]
MAIAQEREIFPPAPNPTPPAAASDDDDDDDDDTPVAAPAPAARSRAAAPAPSVPPGALSRPHWYLEGALNAALADGGPHSFAWRVRAGTYGSVGDVFDYAAGAYAISGRTVGQRVADTLTAGGTLSKTIGPWTASFTAAHQWGYWPLFHRVIVTGTGFEAGLDYDQLVAETSLGRFSIGPSIVGDRWSYSDGRSVYFRYGASVELRWRLPDRLTELRLVTGGSRQDYDHWVSRGPKRVDDNFYVELNWIRSLSANSFIVGRVGWSRTSSTYRDLADNGWTARLVWYFSFSSEDINARTINRVLRDRRTIF